MKKTFKRMAALMLASMLALTGCGGGGSSDSKDSGSAGTEAAAAGSEAAADSGEEKILTFANVFDNLDILDVHKSTVTDVMQTGPLICEPLMTHDKDMNLVPCLLEEAPTLSEDGKIFTCKLKKGVKFHDGSELTSADVEFTFNRIFDPATQNVNTWLCDMILGATDMLDGKADTLAGFRVLDDYSFEIELEYPYSAFESVLSCPQMLIYPKEACEAAGDEWGVTTFVGTGPYVLDEFEPKDHVTVKKFDGYHGNPVSLDGITVYNMDQNTMLLEYEAGNLDIAYVDSKVVSSYKTEEFANNLKQVDMMAIITMNLNVSKAPLDDPKVRKAIGYAVDQESLVQNYLQGSGTATDCLIPPHVLGHDDAKPSTKYDPEKAKALLAEAGYPDGITLTTHVAESAQVADVAVVLKEQLKASNITLEIQKVDAASYTDIRKNGEVQVPFLTWYKDIADPDNFLYTFYHSSNSDFFSSCWHDERTDSDMVKGRTISDTAEREKLYKELDSYLVDEQCIAVPLYNPVRYWLVADGVDNLSYDDSMINLSWATKE
ncbi:MAG: ABC transporter substrate-binding protein [Enterocloster sp.]